MACNHEAHKEVMDGQLIDRCGKCGEILWVYAPVMTPCERRMMWGVWVIYGVLIIMAAVV